MNKCEISPKEFISKVDLKKHMRYHKDVIETFEEEDGEDWEAPDRKRGFQNGNKKEVVKKNNDKDVEIRKEKEKKDIVCTRL